MSSDDEFDDLFSFSSPTKTDASNANGVDSDATDKAPSDDDFLDVFGTEHATTVAVTDTDDSFLDIFDSPPPPDSNKATTAAGAVAMDDIEAEFDLLTADASGAPTSANTAEVATTAMAALPATSVHVDFAQTTVIDGSNMAAQGKSRGDLTAVASAASSEAAHNGSVPSALESAADKTPVVASAEEVNMSEEFPSTGGKPAVSVTDTVPSLDSTVPKEPVLSKSSDMSSASAPTPAPGPSGQAPAQVSAPSPTSRTPSPAPTSEAVVAPPSAKPTNASSTVVKVHATTTSSAATLLHDDVHAHDAGTRDMLNFLEDSDNTEADKVGSVVPSLPVDHSPSADAPHTDLSIPTSTPSVKDNDANKGKDYVGDENDDDDFGAFATVDSATSPMALSPTGGAVGGIDRSRQRLQSEDPNQTEEDGAFDFEKDILGVIPTEEEMAEEKTKQEKEKKAASQTATEEGAADKTLRNMTDTADGKSEGSDTAKSTPLPRAATMAGKTSSVRLPNLTIPSKLSNPLRRKDRAQGGTEGPAPPSSESESNFRGTVATSARKEEGGGDTKNTIRMGSILNSIKAKAAGSTGGSESSNIERAVAPSAKEVNDRAAAAAAAVSATLLPPKISTPPKFETLAEAVRSTKSTPSLIADLFKDEQEKAGAAGWTIADTDRAHLWVKLVTGKTMEDVASGSLIDGFTAWDESFNLDIFDRLLSSNDDSEMMNDPAPPHDALQFDLHSGILDLTLLGKVRCESKQLAHDVDRMKFEGRDSFERNLCSIVLFHHRSMAKYAATAEKGSSDNQWTTSKKIMQHDPHVAGVVAVLLAAPLPPPVASVVLTNLFSSTLPLMGLDDTPFPAGDEIIDISDQEATIKPKWPHQSERNSAICALHSKLYCLATYHLPLLVTHLDRHCPSWWMPASKSPDITGSVGASEERHLTSDTSAGKSSDSVIEFNASGRYHRHEGYIPTSWFVTHCVGIPGTENLDLYQTLLLWDSFLASGDPSLIFFLALAILEASSDDLLMLQGKDLGNQLYKLLTFFVKSEKTSQDGTSNEAGQGDEPSNANATIMKMKKWIEMSMLLEQSTPKSVVKDLSSAEVAVVGTALTRRRDLAEASLKAKLEAEAREERKKRQDDAKRALLKTRLTQYYRRQCPAKIDSVDRILEVYEGRYDVLDSNLRRKYGGRGFLPHVPTISVNPQLSTSTSKLLSSVKDQKAKIAQKIESAAQRQKNRGDEDQKRQDDSDHVSDIGVAVEVKVDEVIPIICGQHTSTPSKDLKFILVDCRPEPSQNEGRFATSVSASSLTDIEKLETLYNTFESLRGAVHIVVMGEGFSAFPLLYHHQLSRNEMALAREDHARAQNCAHFLIKRGYPFVSILDGGFAAAHAWLSRHSTDSNLDSDTLTPSSVLVNYDPKESTAAKMERAKNASSAERTQAKLQVFLDNSMTVLTKTEEAIERRYVTATSAENRHSTKDKISSYFYLGSSGKDGPAHATRTVENANEGKEDKVGKQLDLDGSSATSQTDTSSNTCSTDLIDEKKNDKNGEQLERSIRTNVAAMKTRFSSFSSSVNAVGGRSEDRDSNETAPSTSLKRISNALGQAKKSTSTAVPSSLKMPFGVPNAPFPQSSSSQPSLKMHLKSKISSKIQISSNRQAAAKCTTNANNVEQESIVFHEEE